MATPSRNEVLNRARKNVARSYPGNSELARQVVCGIDQALTAGWSVSPRVTARVEGRCLWVIEVLAPTSERPSRDVAQVLKRSGFRRTTNHSWAYPLLEQPV